MHTIPFPTILPFPSHRPRDPRRCIGRDEAVRRLLKRLGLRVWRAKAAAGRMGS